MQNTSPADLRKIYFDAWHKAQQQQVLEPMEAMIVDVIQRHPEYHPIFERVEHFEELKDERFQISGNPFFHMGLHIAIMEQVSVDKPVGIKAIYQKLLRKTGDQTAAEHVMMECLAKCLVASFNAPGEDADIAYLEALKKLT